MKRCGPDRLSAKPEPPSDLWCGAGSRSAGSRSAGSPARRGKLRRRGMLLWLPALSLPLVARALRPAARSACRVRASAFSLPLVARALRPQRHIEKALNAAPGRPGGMEAPKAFFNTLYISFKLERALRDHWRVALSLMIRSQIFLLGLAGRWNQQCAFPKLHQFHQGSIA